MARFNPALPFRRDPASRFLPWITAFMVYLGLLALAALIAIGAAASRWEEGGAPRLSVQYVAPEGLGAEAAEAAFAAVLETVRAAPGVAAAEPLARAQLIELLVPWLGHAAPYDDLPLPRLIDVVPAPGLDPGALGERLAAHPGAALDDPAAWLAPLATLARSIQAVAAAIVALIALAAVGTVIVSTQMGLAAHRNVIEVLHLIGAEDAYLARKFERQALRLALQGALIGAGLAAATGFALARVGRGIDSLLLPPLALEPWGWGALGALPLALALIVMVTARITVLRALARLP